ncbi:structural protein [Bacillus safensis]|uniref:structural protein n=1 Tax=Bacillus safensis TaxID=561879 RepID=UPI00344B4C2E
MASKFGVSANPTKLERIRSYELRCKTTMTLVLVPTLFHKKKFNGKWETIKTNSRNPLNPGEKLYDQFDIKESFGNKKGTYRFRVDVERYDKKGNQVATLGTFYTSEFYIK